jgi:hypothetical protein
VSSDFDHRRQPPQAADALPDDLGRSNACLLGLAARSALGFAMKPP